MVLLEGVPVIPLQPVPGTDPHESERIPDNTCGYTFRSEALEGLKVVDGEQLLLCEKGMTAQQE
jgi:hypothetical protein